MSRIAIFLISIMSIGCAPIQDSKTTPIMGGKQEQPINESIAQCSSNRVIKLRDDAISNKRLRNYDAAESAYQEVVNIYHKLSRDNSTATCKAREAMALEDLGNLYMRSYFSSKMPDAALGVFNKRLRINRELVSIDSEAYMPELAAALDDVAEVFKLARQGQSAIDARTEVVQIYRYLASVNPNRYEYKLATKLRILAYTYQDYALYEAGTVVLTESLEIDRKLARLDSAHLYYVGLDLSLMGRIYLQTNQYSLSEKSLLEAIIVQNNLAKADPASNLKSFVNTIFTLGRVYFKTNQFDKCEKQYQKAIKIYRSLAETNPSQGSHTLASSLTALGELYKKTNRIESADAAYNEALEIYQMLGNSLPQGLYIRNMAFTLSNLGTLYFDTNRLGDAERYFSDALIAYRVMAESGNKEVLPEISRNLRSLASLYDETQRFSEAETLRLKATRVDQELERLNP